eukprot:271676-Amorphochlora_amoeboformis.AAC.2
MKTLRKVGISQDENFLRKTFGIRDTHFCPAFEEAKQALRQAKKCKSRSSPKPASTEKKNSHEVGVKSGEVDGGGN